MCNERAAVIRSTVAGRPYNSRIVKALRSVVTGSPLCWFRGQEGQASTTTARDTDGGRSRLHRFQKFEDSPFKPERKRFELS